MKRRVVRRTVGNVAPVANKVASKPSSHPKIEDEIEDEIDIEELDDEEDEIDIEELDDDDDVEDIEPEPVKPSNKVSKPIIKKSVVKPVAKPVKSVAKPVKSVDKTPTVELEEIEEVEDTIPMASIKKVGDNVIENLMGKLRNGEALTIVKQADGRYTVTEASIVETKKAEGKLRGNAYWAEVCTPEYLEWEKSWKTMTYADKLKAAKKAGAKWESHDDQRINTIRITESFREVNGIEKYKPEYSTMSSRAAIRG